MMFRRTLTTIACIALIGLGVAGFAAPAHGYDPGASAVLEGEGSGTTSILEPMSGDDSIAVTCDNSVVTGLTIQRDDTIEFAKPSGACNYSNLLRPNFSVYFAWDDTIVLPDDTTLMADISAFTLSGALWTDVSEDVNGVGSTGTAVPIGGVPYPNPMPMAFTGEGVRIVYGGAASSGTVTVTFGENATYGVPNAFPGPLGNTQVFVFTLGGGGTPAPVITSVSPASGTDAGGTSVTITGTDLTGATAVTFGGTAATSFTVDDSTQITATTPAGTVGAVDVAVTTPGGDDTSVGAFIYTAAPAPDPTPAPALPPSAPVGPELTPRDGEVAVSWEAPATQGSFPVTNYQVQSIPSGAGCLVPATQTQCTIGSLTNGTTYEFMVRALNGGGWGPWLDAGSVTPVAPMEASIMITGLRGDVRGKPGVVVEGSTTGLDAGSILHPWIRLPRQDTSTEGMARIATDFSGEFTWQRRTGRGVEQIDVKICTTDAALCSDSLTIRSR